jgi:hypothetical protein
LALTPLLTAGVGGPLALVLEGSNRSLPKEVYLDMLAGEGTTITREG